MEAVILAICSIVGTVIGIGAIFGRRFSTIGENLSTIDRRLSRMEGYFEAYKDKGKIS